MLVDVLDEPPPGVDAPLLLYRCSAPPLRPERPWTDGGWFGGDGGGGGGGGGDGGS